MGRYDNLGLADFKSLFCCNVYNLSVFYARIAWLIDVFDSLKVFEQFTSLCWASPKCCVKFDYHFYNVFFSIASIFREGVGTCIFMSECVLSTTW